MQRRRVFVAAGVALLVVAIAWWLVDDDDADGSNEGITAIDDTESLAILAQCVVADPEGEMTLLPGSFVANQPTRLVSLEMDGADNLELIEAAVSDYRGPEDFQGVVAEYPPRKTSFLEGLTNWDGRQPLAGLMVRPSDGKQVALVGVRLKDPSVPGHVRGVTIETSTDAGPRTIGWEQFALVLPDGSTCTDEAVAETTEWTG